MNKLTRSQQLVIDILNYDEAMSYEDIANETGLSYDGVRGRVSELYNMGYEIERIKDGGVTHLLYKKSSTYRRPDDIKSKITQRIKTVDDFYKITNVLDTIKNKKIIKKRVSKKKKSHNKEAVLLLSDLHIGEIIREPLFNDVVFNTSIATTRMEELTESVINELNSDNINHVTLLGIGDMIDGDMIYRNHLFRVEKPAVEQIQDATRAISSMIKEFVNAGITVDMYNVRGNHGITNYQNLEEDNWDNVIYDMLEIIFESNENVNILNFKGNEGLVNIGNKKIVLSHGSNFQAQIKTASGLRQFRGLCAKHDLSNGDLVVVGHLHEFGIETDQKKFLIRNGSIADSSEYALKLNSYSDPMQTLMIFNEDCIYPVIIPIEVGK